MKLYAYHEGHDNRFCDDGDWELTTTKKRTTIRCTRKGYNSMTCNTIKQFYTMDIAKHEDLHGRYVFYFGNGKPIYFLNWVGIEDSPVKRFINDFGHVVWKWVGYRFSVPTTFRETECAK